MRTARPFRRSPVHHLLAMQAALLQKGLVLDPADSLSRMPRVLLPR